MGARAHAVAVQTYTCCPLSPRMIAGASTLACYCGWACTRGAAAEDPGTVLSHCAVQALLVLPLLTARLATQKLCYVVSLNTASSHKGAVQLYLIASP